MEHDGRLEQSSFLHAERLAHSRREATSFFTGRNTEPLEGPAVQSRIREQAGRIFVKVKEGLRSAIEDARLALDDARQLPQFGKQLCELL